MFSMGGNDKNAFGNIAINCFVSATQSPKGCGESIDAAEIFIQSGGLRINTEKVLEDLDARLSNKHAQIVLMGYPHLSIDDPEFLLSRCVKWDTDTRKCKEYYSYPTANRVREVMNELAAVQEQLVRNWNINNDGSRHTVCYVSSIRSDFAGHEPNPSIDFKNDYRWLNEFWETKGAVS